MELTHRYTFPDRFATGAVGEPDHRVYFVQTRQGSRMTNVVCESAQIRMLLEHLRGVLTELERAGGIDSASHRQPVPDLEPLDVPLDEDFRAGTMTITWLPDEASLRVELFALGAYHHLPEMGQAAADASVLRVQITLDQARDFIARTDELLRTQAPSCPFCAQPITAGGHLCPRANGYRRSLLDLKP